MKRVCCAAKQDKDKISYLPDAIQAHILSFLPLVDAILTSLLSRQWRYSCCSLSNLEFIQHTVEEKNLGGNSGKIVEFVDQVLRCHDVSRIDTIILSVRVDNAPITSDHLEQWASFAVTHRVQTFGLGDCSSPTGCDTLLPCCLFTCATLTRLKLWNIKLKFPKIESICFPMLRSLSLQDTKLSSDKFFSAPHCPSLLKLVIKRCKFKRLFISLPSLKKLLIVDSNSNPNISLSIPNIRNLYCCTEGAPRYISTKTLSSSRRVCFFFSKKRLSSLDKSRHRSLASKIQKGLHNVEKLVMGRFYIEYLMKNPKYLIDSPAAPHSNLKKLKFSYSSKNQVQAIKLLLRSFPKLKDLSMKFEEHPSVSDVDDIDGYWQSNATQSAGNMFKYLKIVELQRFKGRDSEVELARYLLQNARGLEKMKIRYPGHEIVSEENKAAIKAKLLSFPSGSPNLEIWMCEASDVLN
ncbi:hypothetical protein ACHQM5_019591 [Ranunculus cassubicifolius]